MNSPVEKLKALAKEYDVAEISNVILDDPRFPLWSGSSKSQTHHYGTGGLARHVLEVVELCIRNNEYFEIPKRANQQQLFLAALFHDAGKMWDYQPSRPACCIDAHLIFRGTNYEAIKSWSDWESNEHKYMIHHISRSGLVWNEAAKKFNFPDPDSVLHAILSHHGLREWGSPVCPRTRLAWLLHLCDSISARMDDCDKVRK